MPVKVFNTWEYRQQGVIKTGNYKSRQKNKKIALSHEKHEREK